MPRTMKYSDVSAQDRLNYQLYAQKYGWRDCWTAPPEDGFQYMHEDRRRFFAMMGLEDDIPAELILIQICDTEGCFRPDHFQSEMPEPNPEPNKEPSKEVD